MDNRPIGVFDSGYGGLTILKEIVRKLPEYNYVYLGDNARAPYGARSFEVVYEYTREAVHKLFEMECRLVILACNTADYTASGLTAMGSRKTGIGGYPSQRRSAEYLFAKRACRDSGYPGNRSIRILSDRSREIIW